VLIVGITFVIVLIVVVGTYWALAVLPEQRQQAAVLKRLKPSRSTRAARLGLLKDPMPLTDLKAFQAMFDRAGGVLGPLQRLIDQSGIKVTVDNVLVAAVIAATAGGTAGALLTRSLLGGLAGAALAGLVPFAYLKRARSNRIARFEELFPEAIDLVSRALRAGHSFVTGLAMVAEELPDPVGTEFQVLHDQQNFGLGLPTALRNFSTRVPIVDARFFVTAVLTQRDTGGNLSEILDNLSAVIRERFKVKRQVRVASAHARMTAMILAGMPPVLALAIFVMAPDNMKMLVTDPLGIRMVAGAIALQMVGTVIMRKIVNIEY